MRRRFALRAEILDRLHNAPPKVLLPKTIYDHARGQRIVRVHQPICQSEAIGRIGGIERVQHRRRRGVHLFALAQVSTARPEKGFARIFEFFHHRGDRQRIVEFFLGRFCFGERIARRTQSGRDGNIMLVQFLTLRVVS